MTTEEALRLRKEVIKDMAESYYEQYTCLQYEPVDIFVEKTLAMFFDSKMSIADINEQLFLIISDKDFVVQESVTFLYDDDGEYRKEVKRR